MEAGMAREVKVSIYASFEEENEAESRRRARMTPRERMREFAVIQERTWGKDWHSTPMVKKATWEESS